MKKNGFTLVELLGVIVILIVIFLVIYPATRVIINRSETTVYQTQVNKMLKATYDYSLNNLSILPTKNEKNYITLSELIYNGYLDPLKNPNTNDFFPDDSIISIENVGNKYRNRDKYAIKYGDYLYKAEFDEMDTADYLNNKPRIVIENVVETSKGYTIILNQGDVYTENNIIVYKNETSSEDITNNTKIIKNIFFNNEIVNSVDTSKIGIYSVKYVAVSRDITGKVYSSSEVLKITISDTLAPTLTIPTNNTISTTDTTFDIMAGVSCTDNSGKCDVTYTGIINFGVIGTYTLEYKATDSSGNVTTQKRIITVE